MYCGLFFNKMMISITEICEVNKMVISVIEICEVTNGSCPLPLSIRELMVPILYNVTWDQWLKVMHVRKNNLEKYNVYARNKISILHYVDQTVRTIKPLGCVWGVGGGAGNTTWCPEGVHFSLFEP